MQPLLIGGISFAGLLLITCVAVFVYKRFKPASNDLQWLREHGTALKATISQVQAQQGWKEAEGWSRNEWSGEMTHPKLWKTYYALTLQYVDPSNGQQQTFQTTVWSDEVKTKPVVGGDMLLYVVPGA